MEKLDALLDFMEGHIDEEHTRRTDRLHLDAMAYLVVPENSHPWGQDSEVSGHSQRAVLQREIERRQRDRSKGSRSAPGRPSCSTCRH